MLPVQVKYRIHIYGYDGKADYWITHETHADNSQKACDSALKAIRRDEGWPDWVKPRVWKIEQVFSDSRNHVNEQPDEEDG